MRDQRADALAQILVRYSTRVQPDDVCVIQSTTEAEPLVQAIYEEILRAGGLPIMQLSTEGAAPAFYELANEKQLEWIPPTATWAAENAGSPVRHSNSTHASAYWSQAPVSSWPGSGRSKINFIAHRASNRL